jgi:Na+/melibiose symporter-like transporter
VLIVVGHLGSIPTASQNLDDTGAQLVGGVFALGTVVSAVGLVLAGTAVAQTRRWHGWRRFMTLAAGVWTVALLGLQLTAALPLAVAVYAICFAGIGAAVAGSPTRGTPRTPRTPRPTA